MRPAMNRAHWDDWASTYGADLRATTKCHSIKRLELEAISRRIDARGGGPRTLLEVGCGNGYNGLALANRHESCATSGSTSRRR